MVSSDSGRKDPQRLGSGVIKRPEYEIADDETRWLRLGDGGEERNTCWVPDGPQDFACQGAILVNMTPIYIAGQYGRLLSAYNSTVADRIFYLTNAAGTETYFAQTIPAGSWATLTCNGIRWQGPIYGCWDAAVAGGVVCASREYLKAKHNY